MLLPGFFILWNGYVIMSYVIMSYVIMSYVIMSSCHLSCFQFNLHLTGDIHAITAANNLLGKHFKHILFLASKLEDKIL